MTANANDSSDAELRAALHDFGREVGAPGVTHAIDQLAFHHRLDGTRLGDFELGPELGRGGMGVVHTAEQISVPGRKVAVKLLRAVAASETARQRFAREVESIGRLDHPNIVPILSADVQGRVPFYAMKHVEGRSLRETILVGGARDYRAVATMLRDLARALQHAHEHGVVHRDVKPGNVLVDEAGRAMLLDFGLASLVEDDSDLTLSSDAVGTPDYMAPEQVDRNHGVISPRTDVYGLGITLYECLCGRTPFAAATRHETMSRILRWEPTRLRAIDANIPRDLETICAKAIERLPAQRYASAGEMAADLDAFLAHRPLRARPHGLARRAMALLRRHRMAAAGVALGVATFAIAAAYFGWIVPARKVGDRLAHVATLLHSRADLTRRIATATTELGALLQRTPSTVLDQGAGVLQRELRRTRAQRRQLDGEAESALESCLLIEPTNRAVRARYADFLALQLRELLGGGGIVLRGDAVTRWQQRIEHLDDERRHAGLLDRSATLEVRCARGTARVVLCKAEEGPDGRTLYRGPEAADGTDLGNTPLRANVAEGNYALHATLPGCAPIVLPMLLRRSAVRTAAEGRVDLEFHTAAELGAGYVQVHGGFSVGTVPGADPTDPSDELVWHDGFAMTAREVRLADWLQWSGDQPTDAERSQLEDADRPLSTGLTWDRITHIVTRLNAREHENGTGYHVALPTPEQWRRAGQGADARPYPWGWVHDWRFSRNYWSTVDARQSLTFRPSPEEDVSPFGVRELAGSRREVCLPANAMRALGTKQFLLCGGSIYSFHAADLLLTNERGLVHDDSTAKERGPVPNDLASDCGLRLVRLPLPSVPEGPLSLHLADADKGDWRFLAVRGPFREVLPGDERARAERGALVLDGYAGHFSPHLMAWLPIRARPHQCTIDVTFALRYTEGPRRIEFRCGTEPGFDTHDMALCCGLQPGELKLACGEDATTVAAPIEPGATCRLRLTTSKTGFDACLRVGDGEPVFASVPRSRGTPASWRYFGIRLPTYVGASVAIRSLRIEPE